MTIVSKDIEISLNDAYKGILSEVFFDRKSGVIAKVDDKGRPVKFLFKKENNWSAESARKYMKNRGLNQIRLRIHKDGSVIANTVELSAQIFSIESISGSKLETVLGKDKYDQIMKLESDYGSSSPVVLSVKAMNFDGKKEIVANGMRFHRDYVQSNIDSFNNIGMRLGHPEKYFIDKQSYKNRVGNVVKSSLDENGNPLLHVYIYPTGDGKDFRDTIHIANVQGILSNYEVSMYGDVTDYENVATDSKDWDGAFVDIKSWKPTFVDIVDTAAISGSSVMSVVNNNNDNPIFSKEDKKMTLSEILEHLRENKVRIALSDLLSVDSFKETIESYVKSEIDKGKAELRTDKEFRKSIALTLSPEEFSGLDNFKNHIELTVKNEINKKKNISETFQKILANNKIELSQSQIELVNGNLRGDEKEEEIVKMIESAKLFTVGLSTGIQGTIINPNQVEKTTEPAKEETIKLSDSI